MRLEGEALFHAPRERVYQVFTDKDALAGATPGLEGLDLVGENRYEVRIKVGVGGIAGRYKGRLELQNLRPHEHYTLVVSGEGSPGYMKGKATFDFVEVGEGTNVVYGWDVQVGGMVASVGQRVLTGVGKMLIGQFMSAMERSVGLAGSQNPSGDVAK